MLTTQGSRRHPKIRSFGLSWSCGVPRRTEMVYRVCASVGAQSGWKSANTTCAAKRAPGRFGTPEENWRQLNGRRTKSRPAAATLGTSRTTLDPHPLLSPMLPLLVSEVKREPFVKTQCERARPSPASPSVFVDARWLSSWSRTEIVASPIAPANYTLSQWNWRPRRTRLRPAGGGPSSEVGTGP